MHFSENQDFNEVREVQRRILAAYEQDFSKHAPNEIVPRLRMLWNSIPSQLAKENKKFIYGLVREGGRAKEYEAALMWLSDCGLVHKISRVNTPKIPLKAYEGLRAFKLFVVDVGETVVPVEVKAEINLKAKSLKTYREKYAPQVMVRTSMADYRQEDGLVNLPLYAIGQMKHITQF